MGNKIKTLSCNSQRNHLILKIIDTNIIAYIGDETLY